MGRQIAMALVLMGVIAALLAAGGLPWGGPRSGQSRPAGNAATAAIPPEPVIRRPGAATDSDAMAILTRQVVHGLRQAVPDPGMRVQNLAQEASRAMVPAAEAPPPAGVQMLSTLQPDAMAGPAQPAQSSPLPRQRPARMERTIAVGPGDTLTTIAEAAYGRASAWSEIYAANRDRLRRPDLLPQGMVLILPALP